MYICINLFSVSKRSVSSTRNKQTYYNENDNIFVCSLTTKNVIYFNGKTYSTTSRVFVIYPTTKKNTI